MRSAIQSMQIYNYRDYTDINLKIDNDADLDDLIFELAVSIASVLNKTDDIEDSWWYKAYEQFVMEEEYEEADIVEAEWI